MRWSVMLLLLACACDRVFGLAPSSLADAPPFMPDAHPTCPTNGPPAFRPTLFRPIIETCRQYMLAVDAGRALARCGDTLGGAFTIAEGPIDAMPLPASGFDFDNIAQVIVSPDGANAIVFGQLPNDALVTHHHYTRDALGTWSHADTLPQFDKYLRLSTPSRGASPHLLASSGSQVDEYVGGPNDTWQLFHSYIATTDLGAENYAQNLTLTADGTRLLFIDIHIPSSGSGVPTMYYANRDSVDVPFGMAVRAPDLDSYAAQLSSSSDGAYMTEDCGRLYFSAVDSILYVEQ